MKPTNTATLIKIGFSGAIFQLSDGKKVFADWKVLPENYNAKAGDTETIKIVNGVIVHIDRPDNVPVGTTHEYRSPIWPGYDDQYTFDGLAWVSTRGIRSYRRPAWNGRALLRHDATDYTPK